MTSDVNDRIRAAWMPPGRNRAEAGFL